MYRIKNECEGFIRIPNARELMKARGPQAECSYCFRVFGNPDETQCTSIWNSFSIAPRNRIKWKYSRIFHMLSVSLLLRNIISNYYHYYHCYHHHYYNYHYYYLIIIIVLRSVRESGGNVYNLFLSFQFLILQDTKEQIVILDTWVIQVSSNSSSFADIQFQRKLKKHIF